MTIDGKPVRLLLRGDYAAAARWIPHFAALCRAFHQANETRYQQNEEMHGKAQVIGGALYIIDIEASTDVLYYTLVAGDLGGALNRFLVMAWAERPTPVLERAEDDPKWLTDPYGSAYLSRYELDLSLGYAAFCALMARCGGRLLVFFSSSTVTPILIRYRRVRGTGAVRPTYVWPLSNATYAQQACLYSDLVLCVRRPLDPSEAVWGSGIYSMEYTGAVRATQLSHRANVLDSRTVQLAEPMPYPVPPTSEFSNLFAFKVCRGPTAEDAARPTWWLVTRARTDTVTQTEDQPPALIPLYYRYRFKLSVQRRDLYSLDVQDAESALIGESAMHPAPPEGYPYSLGHYVPFFERVEGVLVLIVGRLYTNVPYDFRDRNGGKAMLPGDHRVHVYDRYVFDPDSLELLQLEVDCGYARLVVRRRGGRRTCYAHGFREARFQWVPDSNPNAVFRTYLTGALWRAEIDTATPPQVIIGEKVCDTGFYVKGPLGQMDMTEAQTGFVPEFDD